MQHNRAIRWGIISTASIGRSSFLPALRATGNGSAYMVAGRDLERTRAFAAENGVERAVEGYDALLADDSIDAIYNPLPNSMHGDWTIKALQAGKAVLCEKPLCDTLEETERVLAVARESDAPLWEAFVFPFRKETHTFLKWISDGEIGEVREVQSTFHFTLRDRGDIRLDPDLGGGAIQDVGCYCIALGRAILGEPTAVKAEVRWAPEGVDEETYGIVTFDGEKRLLFSCGMRSGSDTFSRVLGSRGEIRLTNAFHPGRGDVMELHRDGEVIMERVESDEPSFTAALRHIHAVLRGEETPQHLAVDEALGNARAIAMALGSARQQSG